MDGVKYMYLIDWERPRCERVGTIAIDKERKCIGLSIRADTDKFCKKTGRYYANMRLETSWGYIISDRDWTIGVPRRPHNPEKRKVWTEMIEDIVNILGKMGRSYGGGMHFIELDVSGEVM